MKNASIEKFLSRGLEVGVFLSFLGTYFSVSLIGLGTGLVLVFGFLLLLKNKNFSSWTQNSLFLPMVFLILAILVSIALADPYDFKKPLGKVRYLLCFFFFAQYFAAKPSAKTWVLNLAKILAPFLALIAVLQFTGTFSPLPLFGSHPPAPLPYGEGRFFIATGFVFHHSPFAATMIMLFQVLFAHWLLDTKKDRHLKLGLPATACLVGLFCAFSRGAWIAWAISTVVVAAVVHRKFLIGALLGFFSIGLALFVLVPQFRSRVLDIRPSRNEERLELWRICYEMFKESPIFGHGFYSFGSRYQKYTDWHLTREHFPVEAHNMYMDLLAGTGLAGFFAFVFLLVKSVWLAIWEFKKSRNEFTPWALACLGIIVSFIFAGIFDKQFYMTQTLVPNLFFLGILSSHSLTRRQ